MFITPGMATLPKVSSNSVPNIPPTWNVWKYVSFTKEVYWWCRFHLLITNSKICLWSVSYTRVMLHSQWHYWLSSLHKRYPWYKVQVHTRSWDASGGAYPKPSHSILSPCGITILAKGSNNIKPVENFFVKLCCHLVLQLYWR